jgi:hypothetical protein
MIWCVVGFVVSIGVVVDSLIPGGPRLPEATTWLAFIAVFPVWFAVLLKALGGFKRLRRSSLADAFNGPARREQMKQTWAIIRPVPMGIKVFAGVVIALGMFNSWSSFGQLSGQPQQIDSDYVLNNHGTVTHITKDQYLTALADGHRMFAGHAALFYTVAGVLALGVWLTNRKASILPSAPTHAKS